MSNEIPKLTPPAPKVDPAIINVPNLTGVGNIQPVNVDPKANPAHEDFAKTSQEEIKAQLEYKEGLAALEAKLAEQTRNIERLQAGYAGVSSSESKRPKPEPIDWTKITEQDAYSFSSNIQAISYDIPGYLDVELKDLNWVPRWVNINPARMGPMKVVGFIAVKEEDLAKPLALEIGKDADGHYKYIDVILMKVHKSRYMAALKSNFLRSIMLTDQKELHRINQAKMGEFVQSQGPRAAADWAYAQQEGANHRPKMEVYI